jgi:uncharacterized protein YkwD
MHSEQPIQKEYKPSFFSKIGWWFNKRNHHPYNYRRRLKNNLKILFIFAISIIALSVICSNISDINRIVIIFIPLGTALLITALIFSIIYLIKVIKEFANFFKRQRNWIKISLVILLLLLIWAGYSNRETIFNPVSELWQKANFSEFFLTNNESDSNQDNSSDNTFNFKKLLPNPERKEECMKTFDYLNELRRSERINSLEWDERAYNLAVARSKDMYERNYFDHVTPEGECAETMKTGYGFKNYEYLAENAGGMTYYAGGSVVGNCDEALDGWLNSRGHRYNLMYYGHVSGAIGCYNHICIFYGVNHDEFGSTCTTGAEGLAFWNSVGKQPGEV